MTIYNCSSCGKSFFRYDSTVRDPNKVFCCKKCYVQFMKTYMLGKNNPNYGNKWNAKMKNKASKLMKQKYIDNPELKKIVARNKGKKLPETSRKLKDYYKTHKSNMFGKHHKKKTLLLISRKSKNKFNKEYNEKIRKIMELKGHWIPLDEKTDWEIYYKESDWIDKMFNLITDIKQLKRLKECRVFNSRTNKIGLVRDHMYSRRSGFENGVFPEILHHPCNCQLLSNVENIKKKTTRYIDKNDLTLEELCDKILNYKGNWKEQKIAVQKVKEYKNGKRWFNKYK